MYAIDVISEFSVNPIPEPDTTLEALLRQTEEHDTTLTLTTSRRGLVNQINTEAVAETLEITAQHPRLLGCGHARSPVLSELAGRSEGLCGGGLRGDPIRAGAAELEPGDAGL